MRATARIRCFLLIFFSLFSAGASLSAADSSKDLTGKWTGSWTDGRPNTGNSGGPLWAEATKLKDNEWKIVFRISKTKVYEAIFKGKLDKEVLRFSGFHNVGDERGLYYWTAVLEADSLKGTYEGPDEKGTFVLKKDAEAKP